MQLILMLGLAFFSKHSLSGTIIPVADSFIFMEATRFTEKPNFSSLGIITVPVLYEQEFFDKNDAIRFSPSINRLRETAGRIGDKFPLTPVVVLDIERWIPLLESPDLYQIGVSKYQRVLKLFRASYKQDNALVGFYSVLPLRNYWDSIKPVDSEEYQLWISKNDRTRPLAKQVDALFPSLYTFYEDIEGWKKFAKMQVKEARRLGNNKPVYCFLSPRYHHSNKTHGGRNLPGIIWKEQLKTVFRLADGVIIWDGRNIKWDENAEWWKETKTFIKNINSE